jgi:chromosome segregation ATPase
VPSGKNTYSPLTDLAPLPLFFNRFNLDTVPVEQQQQVERENDDKQLSQLKVQLAVDENKIQKLNRDKSIDSAARQQLQNNLEIATNKLATLKREMKIKAKEFTDLSKNKYSLVVELSACKFELVKLSQAKTDLKRSLLAVEKDLATDRQVFNAKSDEGQLQEDKLNRQIAILTFRKSGLDNRLASTEKEVASLNERFRLKILELDNLKADQEFFLANLDAVGDDAQKLAEQQQNASSSTDDMDQTVQLF